MSKTKMELIEFEVNGYDISFYLKEENRKSIRIKIFPPFGEISVKCPFQTDIDDVKKFVEKNTEKIKPYREKLRLKFGSFDKFEGMLNPVNHLRDIYILGKKYDLNIRDSIPKDEILIKDDEISIFLKNLEPNYLQKKIDDWLKTNAKTVFQNRLNACLQFFPKLNLPELEIKKLKSRYGSYSSSHKITLNLKLIHTSTDQIDFVIIHELCHAYHMNHGREFKGLLTSILPNWKQLKSELDLFFKRNIFH